MKNPLPQDPILQLLPFFDWLDGLVDQYGLYVYMVACWIAPFLIVWILCGGFWRRPFRPRVNRKPRGGETMFPEPPVLTPPPVLQPSESDCDVRSFSA